MAAKPDSFPKASLDPISPTGCSELALYKNTALKLLGRLPDQGKKIGRKSLALLEQRIDLSPALKTQRPGKPIFSDQLSPLTVYALWRADGPELCGHPWLPFGHENRVRLVSYGSMVETFSSFTACFKISL